MRSQSDFNVDAHGHLLDISKWTPAWIDHACTQEGLENSAELYRACTFARSFFQRYDIEPTILLICRYIHQKTEDIESPGVWLSCLFPHDTLRQLTKTSGLPLPQSCLQKFDRQQ